MDNFSTEVLSYIHEHRNTDILQLLLKKSPFDIVPMKLIVRQIQGQRIAKDKFPLLLDHPQYIYPRKLSLEQASSQLTAEYKRSLMTGNSFADLTGGMGIDSYFLGNDFEDRIYVEPNELLYKNTMRNFGQLDHHVEGFNTTCEAWLSSKTNNSSRQKLDWIYLDPSRRTEGNRKTSIENYEPNIIKLRDELLAHAHQVMIKLSPMQDITECINALRSIHHIYIISIKNDVKELLLIMTEESNENPKITAIDLDRSTLEYEAHFLDQSTRIGNTTTLDYIYQPSSALVKSGLHDHNAQQLQLKKLHANTQLYTSNNLLKNYFGRIFKVEQAISSSKKKVRKEVPEGKANIISKNYPLSPAQIGNKLGISDGGDQYILAYTDAEDRKVMSLCMRLI